MARAANPSLVDAYHMHVVPEHMLGWVDTPEADAVPQHAAHHHSLEAQHGQEDAQQEPGQQQGVQENGQL